MMATFVHAQGALPSAPPQQLPGGVIALVGWTDRVLIVSAWAWVTVVAWHAIGVAAGHRTGIASAPSC
jgi:hypothetical protein